MADAVAKALINVHTQNVRGPSLECLFRPQSPEVNTAGMFQMARWRDAKTIETFLKNGADVNGKDKYGFSVLDIVISAGASGQWNEEVFKVLAKYNVKREVTREWIIADCCRGAPQYVRDFLGLDEV
jgi:hypothetical protein